MNASWSSRGRDHDARKSAVARIRYLMLEHLYVNLTAAIPDTFAEISALR